MIRNKQIKEAFLSILEDVEEKNANPKGYLTAIILMLLEKTAGEKNILDGITLSNNIECLIIDTIIEMLEEHFSMERASRLPVVAIYTIYQLLLENVRMYKNKKLLPLKSHTISDRYMGYADVEIYDSANNPFEMVEVKHKIPIDKTMILDVLDKIKGSTIKRYFILTTATPNFKGSKTDITKIVRKIKIDFDKDLIPNGIIPSLKYYLRLVPDLKEFLEKYTVNLVDEFKQGSDVKVFHIEEWKNIIQKHNVVISKSAT